MFSHLKDSNPNNRLIFLKKNDTLPLNEYKFQLTCVHSKRYRSHGDFPDTSLEAYLTSWSKVKDTDEVIFHVRRYAIEEASNYKIKGTDKDKEYMGNQIKCNYYLLDIYKFK